MFDCLRKTLVLYSAWHVLFLHVRSFAKEPDGSLSYANQELFYYCDTKDYDPAKRACEDKDAYLVKIDDANMTEVVNSLINQTTCSYPEGIFIGAKATHHPDFPNDGSKRIWKWLDGSKVSMPGDAGYQNWNPGQPNDAGGREDCLILNKEERQWVDTPCSGEREAKYYICQKKTKLSIEVNDVLDGKKCLASAGSWLAHTEWRRKSAVVSNNSSHTVYQTKSPGSAILRYENATIGDAGEYICVAWAGYDAGNKEDIKEKISVNGTPTIISINSFSCNTSLHVLWKPHFRSLGFPHNISTSAYIADKEEEKVVEVTPTETKPYFIEFAELAPSTEYVVKVVACKETNDCPDAYATTRNATTFGTNLTVTDASILQNTDTANDDTCIITWHWPYNISATFQIALHHNKENTTNNSLTEYVNITGASIYSFDPILERVYEVEIRPIVTSKKYCTRPVKAVGSCVGKRRETNTEKSKHNQTNIMMIAVPSAAVGGVVLIAIVIFAIWKRIKSIRQPSEGMTFNPIYGATDYGHLHSSSNQKKVPKEDAGEGCSTIRNEESNDVAHATTADLQSSSDAAIYATVDKANRKAVEKEGSSGETKITKVDEQAAGEMVVNPIYDMEPFTSTATHDQPATSKESNSPKFAGTSATDDPIYSAVDKTRKKRKKKGDRQNAERD